MRSRTVFLLIFFADHLNLKLLKESCVVQQILYNPELLRLKPLYESVLGEFTRAQKTAQSVEVLDRKPQLSGLEEKEIELGLRLDEIESQIVNTNCSNLAERLEYIRIVLGILARRESLTEHSLVKAMEKCLTSP